MGLTNGARDLICTMVVGGAYTSFNNANARVGVGSSTTAFAASQTDLQTPIARKGMDAGYPTQPTSNSMRWRATFNAGSPSGEGDGSWQEWGIFNAASAGLMFNRKVENLGTKPNTQSWQITCDMTLTAA
jgi:hypothetical protein